MPDKDNIPNILLDDPIRTIEIGYELGWTDGLPVVPPTEYRVSEFLERSNLSGAEIIGEIPERRREITSKTIAANSVMAGCRPEYFPVVITASKAMLAPQFNLVGPSSSLGGSAILVIVNGPIIHELGINSRGNLFGPGNRANATIGRAIRLILMNACAAIPGLFDRSVIGHPGKFSYCIGEADSESHWPGLHEERGCPVGSNAVTVFAAEAPRQVRAVGDPEAILYSISDAASSLGTSLSTSGSIDKSVGVRQGEIAVTIAGNSSLWSQWSKPQVKQSLFSQIRRSVADLKRAKVFSGSLSNDDETTFIPLLESSDDILLLFAGGEEANFSSVIPSWGPKVASTAVTLPIDQS
jgi:hypothetical protein